MLRTTLLMSALTALLVVLGNAVAGKSGALVFFGIALVINLISYFNSDKIAIRMTGSYPVTRDEAPELYALVEKLCISANLPMPRLYLTPSPQPNAFATGRDPEHAVVAVTEGILGLLSREELEGVLAHELAHIKNRDILISSIAAAFAGAITMLANIAQFGAFIGMGRDGEDDEGIAGLAGTLLLAILAPIAAAIVQMAISRSREYMADATGAEIAGSPRGLANALLRLEQAATAIPSHVNPAASHMFIVNPLAGFSWERLFSTHPPIEDRVRRLLQER